MADSLYSKALDTTFHYGDDGKLIGSEKGFHSGDSDSQSPKTMESTGPRLGTTKKVGQAMAQTGKDAAVDLATQLPLMVGGPEAGVGTKLLRQVGSLVAGFGTDQMLNSDKPKMDSAEDALFNSAIGNLVPHMVQNKINLDEFKGAKGLSPISNIGALLKGLSGEARIPEVSPTTPVVRGAMGRMVSNKANYATYMNYLKQAQKLKEIAHGAGAGANIGLDLLNNLSNDK